MHSNERRGPTGAEPLSDVGPSSTVVGLDEQELAALRQVGGHWERVLRGRQEWLRAGDVAIKLEDGNPPSSANPDRSRLPRGAGASGFTTARRPGVVLWRPRP